MRVISGKFKGKQLFSPQGKDVRPTTDRIKESVFNILSCRIEFDGARVLDLFSGSGALGIEALSRGAELAVFVDKSPDSVRLVKKNLEFCQAQGYEVYNTDYAVALRKLEGRQFDVIFLDPPYSFENMAKLLDNISQIDILAKNGIIILESAAENDLPKIPDSFIIDTRRMGGTTISLITK